MRGEVTWARASARARSTSRSRRRCPDRDPPDRATRRCRAAARARRPRETPRSRASSAWRYAASFAASRAARLGVELQRAHLDVAAIVIGTPAAPSRARGRARPRASAGCLELDVGEAEADVRERERRIEPERLIERSRRFNPDVTNAGTRVPDRRSACASFDCRRRVVVRAADAGANRDRPLEDLERHDRNRVRRVRRRRRGNPLRVAGGTSRDDDGENGDERFQRKGGCTGDQCIRLLYLTSPTSPYQPYPPTRL